MEAYKIFDLGVDGPKTLVTDGSRAEPYESGFHAYYTLDDIYEWLRRAKNLDNRVRNSYLKTYGNLGEPNKKLSLF